MSTNRVMKKISTPFEDLKPEGAILLINMLDPQVATLKVFLEAIKTHRLAFFAIANKMDLARKNSLKLTQKQLGIKMLPACLVKKRGLEKIKKKIAIIFKSCKKIIVLGIFNSGKSTLISRLIGKKLAISDLPGTTLKLTAHNYKKWQLIDTVGQVIDVNKPMMVSIDLSGCKNSEGKIARILRADAEGILATLEIAIPQIKKVVVLLKRQIKKGKKIIVVGAGGSSLPAIELAGQGLETGMPVMVFTNNIAEAGPVSFSKGTAEEEAGLSKYINLAVNPGDIVIGISASGGTGFVYDTLRRARHKKAISVAITENIDTPIGKAADYIIKSNAKPEGPSSSKIQIAHLAIVHALCLTLADERGITADQSINFMLPEKVATKKMGIK